ncbi:hypothetical protein LY76DRAFT_175619 [Colletotrichum caudatum]|nr:hypothetical protein LY76DRAFT_175619 [Colletotrichum caudatum]
MYKNKKRLSDGGRMELVLWSALHTYEYRPDTDLVRNNYKRGDPGTSGSPGWMEMRRGVEGQVGIRTLGLECKQAGEKGEKRKRKKQRIEKKKRKKKKREKKDGTRWMELGRGCGACAWGEKGTGK